MHEPESTLPPRQGDLSAAWRGQSLPPEVVDRLRMRTDEIAQGRPGHHRTSTKILLGFALLLAAAGLMVDVGEEEAPPGRLELHSPRLHLVWCREAGEGTIP